MLIFRSARHLPAEHRFIGQEIGRLGDTGNAKGKGSHVHMEVFDTDKARNARYYNPMDWMNGRLPPKPRKGR